MSEPVLDFTTLLNPIEGENPSGASLRYDGTYDQIKEARREDEVFAQGDWSRDLKVADWKKVVQLATDALTSKTKDLQIAAWLTEGLAKHDRQDRWAGLRDGLQLMRSLQENFWDTIYPEIDPEDDEGQLAARANVIASMEQRLADSVKEFPLIAGARYSYLNYLDSKQFDVPENFASLEFEQQEKISALKAEAEAAKKTTGEDWRKAKCDILTLGQYLQPTLKHLPVAEFIPPAKFELYGEQARKMGFVHVASGPMVRSSYHADDFSPAAIAAHKL